MKHVPWSYETCKTLVHQKYDPSIYSYFDDELSSAGDSNQNNVDAIHQFKMIPHYLDLTRNTIQLQKKRTLTLSSPEIGTTHLAMDFPFFVCPFAFPSIYAPFFTTQSLTSQCERSQVQCVLSIFTRIPIEEYPSTVQMVSLNITCYEEINRSLIQRLKNKNIKVLIVAMDTQYYHIGSGIMDRQGDVTKTSEKIFCNLLEDPYFNKLLFEKHHVLGSRHPAIARFVRSQCRVSSTDRLPVHLKTAVTFAKWCMNEGFNCMNASSHCSIAHLKQLAHSQSPLCESIDSVSSCQPIALVVKGVLSVKDALTVQKQGVDGIYVSNHGGRFVWNCVPSIQVLSSIRKAVKNKDPLFGVWFDSGIRHGADIVTALQLGADYVGICRPLIYSFALRPKQGVYEKLEQMKIEFHQQWRLHGLIQRID